MISCALAFAAFLTPGADVEEFSVDLFLVGNNSTILKSLNWLKDGKATTPIERALTPVLQPLAQEKKQFVIIDGGDCSAFPQKGKQIEGAIIKREYDSHDSATESITANGVTKKRVVARTETESTGITGYYPRPIGDFGYVAQSFIHFRTDPENRLFISVQDLNSYRTAIKSGTAQDKENLDKTLLLSSASIQTSKRFLKENRFDFNGVCISAWGLSDPADPNFVSFPPEGRAAHYKLFRKGGKWGVRFLEYLQAE